MRGLRLPHGHHHSITLQVLSCRFYFFLLQFLLWISSWKKRCDIIALWNPISAALASKKIPKHDSLKSSTGLKGKVFRNFGTEKTKFVSPEPEQHSRFLSRKSEKKTFFWSEVSVRSFFSSFSPINSWKVFFDAETKQQAHFFLSFSLSLFLSPQAGWICHLMAYVRKIRDHNWMEHSRHNNSLRITTYTTSTLFLSGSLSLAHTRAHTHTHTLVHTHTED